MICFHGFMKIPNKIFIEWKFFNVVSNRMVSEWWWNSAFVDTNSVHACVLFISFNELQLSLAMLIIYGTVLKYWNLIWSFSKCSICSNVSGQIGNESFSSNVFFLITFNSFLCFSLKLIHQKQLILLFFPSFCK